MKHPNKKKKKKNSLDLTLSSKICETQALKLVQESPLTKAHWLLVKCLKKININPKIK